MISVLELRSVRGTGGGPEKTILLGATQHDHRRFRITVCYVRDMRDEVFGIDEQARRLGVDYVEIREQHSFDRSVWSQLLAVGQERRVDIVHGHDYKTNLFAWLLARRLRAIPMATSHGWTGHSLRERWLYYPGDRRILRRMPRVVAVSTDVRNELIRAGTPSPSVRVLLNGIDPAAFRRDALRRVRMRSELGVGADVKLIGAVGRLEPQKRFDLLLEAFAAVHDDWRATRLVIAGDGSLRDDLEDQARRLGIVDACRFLGHRFDVADLQDAFDVFVQSSDYEGTPNAVLEAMAMETPVVATDAGGTGELAEPGVHALIVPAGDVARLAVALRNVLADPASAWRRAVAARARVERDLSFAGRTRRLEEIYEELMADAKPGRIAERPAARIGAISA
jgi:glycosyltransferase involved in cell wall biosynthesis